MSSRPMSLRLDDIAKLLRKRVLETMWEEEKDKGATSFFTKIADYTYSIREVPQRPDLLIVTIRNSDHEIITEQPMDVNCHTAMLFRDVRAAVRGLDKAVESIMAQLEKME